MTDTTERFTLNSKELDEKVVTEGQVWKGEIWELKDHHRQLVMWFDTQQEARKALAFVREYMQRHGDIDLGIFPDSLSTPLRVNPIKKQN